MVSLAAAVTLACRAREKPAVPSRHITPGTSSSVSLTLAQIAKAAVRSLDLTETCILTYMQSAISVLPAMDKVEVSVPHV